MTSHHTRITYKSKRPNPLFLQWILELHAEAVAKNSRNQYSTKEAINSLKRYPIPLQSGAECAILKGFGKHLCAYLDNRLVSHHRQISNGKSVGASSSFNHENVTVSISNNVQQSLATAQSGAVANNLRSPPQKIQMSKNNQRRTKGNKQYKPRYRTGPYAILIALMEHINSCSADMSLTKEELIEKAQQFCEESFTRPKPDSHHTAWSSMTRLENKQLVTRVIKKKAHFTLTDSGYALATELYEEHKDRPVISIDADSFASFSHTPSTVTSSSRSSQSCRLNNQLTPSRELDVSVNHMETDDVIVSTSGDMHVTAEKSLTTIMPETANGAAVRKLQWEITNRGYEQNKSHIKNNEPYKPRYRTGPYAILHALMKHVNSCPNKLSLTEEELAEKAQPYCEESYFFTSAFVTQLVNEGLIRKVKREKDEICLTDSGYLLAIELCEEYQDMPTTADIENSGSFRNTHLSLAPSSNQSRSSQQSGSQLTSSQFSSQSTLSTEVEDIDDIIDSQDILVMQPDSFEIILLIDKQEVNAAKRKDDHATVTQFDKYENLNREYRHLKVGDFTWVARHKTTKQELVLPYIIERKRMDDLGMSIKDGRFHEQKFRLNKCGIPNVIYLIENFGKNLNVGLPLMSLMQSISNTRVQNSFKIHTTSSLAGTVRFLAIMTKRLAIDYKNKELKGHFNTATSEFLMTFKYFNMASAKSKTLTVQEAFIKMLLQLKGMSVEKALAITQAYNTPRVLIEMYKSCSQKEGEMLLAKQKYDELCQNVGPVVSKVLYKLFTLEVFQ